MNHQSRPIKLNHNQAEAAQSLKGPVLVVAGAGTGKTSVLIERIKRLMGQGIDAKRIFALTFTEKAAAEMQDRVNGMIGTINTELNISTFNAFGESMLRTYAPDIGLNRNFKLVGDNAQIVFLRERLDQLNLDYYAPISSPDSQLSYLSDYFSLLKQNVITPSEYIAFASKLPQNDNAEILEKKKHQELANAFQEYLKLMKDAGFIDYDDQIYLLIELFKQRPNVLKKARGMFDYIMVDEFQDTNKMQSVLVDMLVNEDENLFVVGDDDQSIYGWRGATLANILDFKTRYPQAKDITLVENYRSNQEILDVSYKLIQYNNPYRLEEKLNINKKLKGQKNGIKPVVNKFETIEEELHWIADDIKNRISGGTEPGSIAVLARRNQTLERIHSKFSVSEIEHVVIGRRFELYNEPIIRNIIEAIKTVVDPLDNTSLYHTLTGPFFDQPVRILSELAGNARRNHHSLSHTIMASEDSGLTNALTKIQSWTEASKDLTVGQLAYLIIDDSGFKHKIIENPEIHGLSGQRLSDYFQTLRDFESIAIVPSALHYIESLPALQSAGESLEDDLLDLSTDNVNVLSIHKSKGLEWPLVYIVDCTEGSFPLSKRAGGIELPDRLMSNDYSEADDHMREERRLMYVAMTRAKDELILTYADRHTSSSSRKPSRFIAEAFDDDDTKSIPSNGIANISIHSPSLEELIVDIPKTILSNGTVDLTVSQVKSYLDCPLDFYYKYVLCVPQEPAFNSSYGTLMHSLLEELNRLVFDGRDINYRELESQLIKAWPQYGHVSAKQKGRSLAHAKHVLQRLCRDIQSNPRKPVSIEDNFKINVPEFNINVRGRYDAVFSLGNSVEIVDYKTSSSVNTPDKAKARASSSEQLTLYALAWYMTHDELPALVTLDFIDTGMRGSLKKTQRGLDGALRRLENVASGIRNRSFPPGKDHRYCIHPSQT